MATALSATQRGVRRHAVCPRRCAFVVPPPSSSYLLPLPTLHYFCPFLNIVFVHSCSHPYSIDSCISHLLDRFTFAVQMVVNPEFSQTRDGSNSSSSGIGDDGGRFSPNLANPTAFDASRDVDSIRISIISPIGRVRRFIERLHQTA